MSGDICPCFLILKQYCIVFTYSIFLLLFHNFTIHDIKVMMVKEQLGGCSTSLGTCYIIQSLTNPRRLQQEMS